MKLIKNRIENHIKCIGSLQKDLKKIDKICKIIYKALKKGNKIIFFGNGGSAADSQHLAAEFICKFEGERISLPAIALTTDTSIITAVGNDFGFEKIFERQIDGLSKPGDIVIGISTSGNSKNVLNGIRKAKEKNCFTIGLLGNNGGYIKLETDLNIIVENNNTALIQESHIFIGHTICDIVNRRFKED